MPMRLRLAMHGKTHQKVFHLVAIDARARRQAQPAELLGVYNPHVEPRQQQHGLASKEQVKTMQWSVDRIRYWLHVGAQPSKSVVKLLELGGILKPGSIYHPHRTPNKQGATPPAPPKRPSPLETIRERIDAKANQP
ncbi:Ribosomal protein [Mycena kentingensis (nom. inval.)]|nr:Ribosomal protein [Mycena kentingensis (nom. inval.)]